MSDSITQLLRRLPRREDLSPTAPAGARRGGRASGRRIRAGRCRRARCDSRQRSRRRSAVAARAQRDTTPLILPVRIDRLEHRLARPPLVSVRRLQESRRVLRDADGMEGPQRRRQAVRARHRRELGRHHHSRRAHRRRRRPRSPTRDSASVGRPCRPCSTDSRGASRRGTPTR